MDYSQQIKKFFLPRRAPKQAVLDGRGAMNDERTARGRGRPRMSGESHRPAPIRALDRGLTVLARVADEDRATLTTLAATADMAPSTLYRVLETLRRHDLVAFDTLTQTWSVGVEAFRIGHGYARHTNYLAVGREVMRQLSEDSGETANIAVIESGELVYVAQIETQAPIRAFFPAGTRGVPQASGIGKALLAYMNAIQRAELLATPPPAFTANTLTDVTAVEVELERTRERGWAVDDEERHVGMRCIAAPIFNEYGEPIAGLSISAPVQRFPTAELERQGPKVRAAADVVTARVGGRSPTRAG